LQKAVALKPGDRAAQYQLVAVLRSLGKAQEATRLVGQLRKGQGEESLNSQMASEGTKANELLQSGKPAEAAQIYRHMLEESPDNAWTAYNLALALEAMNDMKGAEDTLRDAIKIDPKMASIQAELGHLELAKGDLQSAQKWLESALDLEPGLVEARGNLAMLFVKKAIGIGRKTSSTGRRRRSEVCKGPFEPGLILAQQNRKSDAEEELEKAVVLSPNDPPQYRWLERRKCKWASPAKGLRFFTRW